MDPKTLLDIEKTLKSINKKTKAIMPVHLYGNMVDIKKLRQKMKSLKRRIYVIEDPAHCFEGKYNNYLSGKWSDCAIFSFLCNKKHYIEGGAQLQIIKICIKEFLK